jgi:hypothetical protein
VSVTINVQDANLNVIYTVPTWSALTATLKLREVGTGQFTAPHSAALYDAVTTENNRISIVHQRAPGVAPYVFMSGPIEVPGAYRWALGAQDQSAAPPGQLTVNFASNECYLAERYTFPDPAHGAGAQTTDYYVLTATNGEVALRNLANLNAGPGAVVARRVAHLILGAVASVGANVTVSTRWEVLTDVLRAVAVAAMPLGQSGLRFRVDEVGKQLVFVVSAPTDLTKLVRFSPQLGNLRSLDTNPQAPSCTAAIVGGSGVGSGRLIVERLATGLWRRIEKFVNAAGGDTATGMQQAGDQALTEGAPSVGLNAVAIDSQYGRYGDNYTLNDLVNVELVPGVPIADYVTAVTLVADPKTGEAISPTIGTGDPKVTPRTVTLIRDMQRRMARLEGG